MDLTGLFASSSEKINYSQGDTIFEAGDPGDAMYVVLEGRVDIRLGDRTLNTIGPGEVFGEMALIDSKPRSAAAVAAADSVVAAVDQDRFMFMVQQTPFFAIHMMQVLAERIRRGTTSENE